MAYNPETPDISRPVAIIGPRPDNNDRYPFWLSFAARRGAVEAAMAGLDDSSRVSKIFTRAGRLVTGGLVPFLDPGERRFVDLAPTRQIPWAYAEFAARKVVRDPSAGHVNVHDIALGKLQDHAANLPGGYLGFEVENVLVDPDAAMAHAWLRRAARVVDGKEYPSRRALAEDVAPLTSNNNVATDAVIGLLDAAHIIHTNHTRFGNTFTGLPVVPFAGQAAA